MTPNNILTVPVTREPPPKIKRLVLILTAILQTCDVNHLIELDASLQALVGNNILSSMFSNVGAGASLITVTKQVEKQRREYADET